MITEIVRLYLSPVCTIMFPCSFHFQLVVPGDDGWPSSIPLESIVEKVKCDMAFCHLNLSGDFNAAHLYISLLMKYCLMVSSELLVTNYSMLFVLYKQCTQSIAYIKAEYSRFGHSMELAAS